MTLKCRRCVSKQDLYWRQGSSSIKKSVPQRKFEALLLAHNVLHILPRLSIHFFWISFNIQVAHKEKSTELTRKVRRTNLIITSIWGTCRKETPFTMFFIYSKKVARCLPWRYFHVADSVSFWRASKSRFLNIKTSFANIMWSLLTRDGANVPI